MGRLFRDRDIMIPVREINEVAAWPVISSKRYAPLLVPRDVAESAGDLVDKLSW